VDNDAIAQDYALTRIGREPARAMIMERLNKEPLFASNSEAALNMFTCRCVVQHPSDSRSYLFILAPRDITMLAFLDLLDQDEKYSGVEGYVRRFTGLGDEDIATIRRNLLVPAADLAAPSKY
jgi:hypothetical protein